jgi:hypothetical protein
MSRYQDIHDQMDNLDLLLQEGEATEEQRNQYKTLRAESDLMFHKANGVTREEWAEKMSKQLLNKEITLDEYHELFMAALEKMEHFMENPETIIIHPIGLTRVL